MSEPQWLDTSIVLDVHAEQLALFGGADGVRDLGLLESGISAESEMQPALILCTETAAPGNLLHLLLLSSLLLQLSL